MKKRILSIVLALAMVLALFPAAIFATEDGGDAEKVAKIGETEYETLATAVAEAEAGAEIEILKAGTYAVPTGKDLIITGAVDGVKFEGTQNMRGANVTFNNVTFNWADNSTYKGLQHAGNLVYNNCTINGQVFLYGASETFNKCTFNQTTNNYNVWTYGAAKVVFNECTFNSAGKSVLIYNEQSYVFNDVTFNNCKLIASAEVEGKAAIEMDSSLTAGIKLTINGTSAEGFAEGNVSGNTLWNNKKGNEGNNNDIVVIVDDVTALDPNVKVENNEPEVDETKNNVVVEKVEGSDEAVNELKEAVSKIEIELDKIAEDVEKATDEEIAVAVEKIEAELAAENNFAPITDIAVETKLSLDVKVEEAVLSETSSLTVNITPVVTTTVSAAGKVQTIKKEAEVSIPVTVTIPLPANYFQVGQQLTVIHTKDEGEKYYHPVTVQKNATGLYVEFVNENGFSLFTVETAHKVTFVDTKGADITEQVKIAGVDTFNGTLPAGTYAVVGVNGAVCKPVVFDVAGETEVTVLSAPVFGTELGDLPTMIAAYYDAIYELAYFYADTLGYVDVAVDGLKIALDSLDIAKDYVAANAPAEYEAVKGEMLEELDNTKETLNKAIELLENDDLDTVDSLIAEVLGLEDQLWAHLETLKDLAYELGLELDPYIIKLNDAVVKYAELVDTTIVDAYNTLVETVDGFVAAYEAWVEKMGAAADQISPELGAAVRKFFNDSAADAVAIVAAYGEEAIFELFDVVGDAAGDIVDVALNLADVMAEYGLKIYEAVKDNPEVSELLADVKAQLAEVETLVKAIAQMKTGAVINAAIVADKEALLQAAYDELVVLYNELTEVLYSVIDDVDEKAAAALDAALTALCDTLCITYNAADGYLGWLAGRADAMACEILCAVLDNLIELVVTASPIMDQWMYDWLYNNPEEVIAFFIENEAEIDALVAKYGPCVVAVLGYVANTYGPEVLDFIINNPCEALDMFMDWYNKYGYRIWPMIDVYLEALGVYDAIDEQLGIVNDKIMAMLSELDAHILAQIAALKAALLDASEELRAQIEAEIEALYEQLMAFLKANISAYYVVGPNSYYVALGDAGAYGPAADKLAAELGMSDKYANLTFADASASEVLEKLDAAEIAKADLITLGFGANTFTAAVAADVMNAAFGEIVEKDWAALVGEEGAAAIEAALVELTAYVAEEVEDEAVAALLTAAVESFAYTYINHLVDYVVVSEAIHEINADALLVLVGMHNPMDGVVIDLDGEELDLGEYLNYLVMLTNIYSFGYALIAEDTIYVDAPAVETNYDGAVMDIKTFVSDLLGFEEAVVKYQPTDAGYKYIQEQIYNALNPTLYEEEEACQHGAPANVKFQWAGDYSTCVAVYVCPDCGVAFTKDCLVTVETVNPTVEKEGLMTYTATVEFFGKEYSETKEVVLPKLPAPDTGDTTMIGLYVTVMLFAAAGAVVVLKKKKHA